MSARLDSRPTAVTFDLEDLVERAWQGRIRIPHFQRPFRWAQEDVIRLFDSVLRGYPIGSVLLWVRAAPAQRITIGNLHLDAPELPQALLGRRRPAAHRRIAWPTPYTPKRPRTRSSPSGMIFGPNRS